MHILQQQLTTNYKNLISYKQNYGFVNLLNHLICLNVDTIQLVILTFLFIHF